MAARMNSAFSSIRSSGTRSSGSARRRATLAIRALAWSSHYVKATWDKHKLVMAAGELSVRQKQIAALGVAMNASSRYLIERLTRTLLRAGQPRGDILEVAAVVDHANCMNKIADGMELPSDIVAPGHETEV